jgi:hypothetical protein
MDLTDRTIGILGGLAAAVALAATALLVLSLMYA